MDDVLNNLHISIVDSFSFPNSVWEREWVSYLMVFLNNCVVFLLQLFDKPPWL